MGIPSPSEKQGKIFWNAVTTLAVTVCLFVIGLAVLGGGWLINRLSTVLIPLAIAVIMAYLLDPLVDWVERRWRVTRFRAVSLTYAGIVLGVLGVGCWIVPKLIGETVELVRPYLDQVGQMEAGELVGMEVETVLESESFGAALKQRIIENSKRIAEFGETLNRSLSGDASKYISDAWVKNKEAIVNGLVVLGTAIAKWGYAVALDFFSGVGVAIGYGALIAMSPVFAFFFLLEKRTIVASWTEYLPVTHPVWKRETIFVLTQINDSLIAFFRGQVLIAMIIGILLMIGFSLVGLKYAILLGLLAGAFSIVPFLGIILSIVPAVTLAAIQFGDVWHPLFTLLVFTATQVLEGLVITPRIMGDKVGLHPLVIILSVLVGAQLLGGIAGGILAIPLTAAARALMIRYVWKKDPDVKVELGEEAS